MKLINKALMICLLGLLGIDSDLGAQVGINILNPDTSAILHLESTDRGFLPPRMSRQQRDNIFDPKAGLMLYNTTDSNVQYYTGRCWLNTWQRNCDDCVLDFQIERLTGNIDRLLTEVDSTRIFVRQLAGVARPVALYIIPNLPQGLRASLSQNTVNGSDTLDLRVEADLFTPPGTYPIIVQAVCGNAIGNQVFLVTVEPCIEVDILGPQVSYNLQAANNLPNNQPICVVARIASGVILTSANSSSPVFTTGNLHPNSRVGIWNQGDMFGRGGNGGQGAGLGTTGEGLPGSHALNLTVPTQLLNQGRIYGGGGGGGSVGFSASIPIPGISFTLGIGAGGGGGAQLGQGGNLAGGFGFYEPGLDATGGLNAQAGRGGILTSPISFAITVVNITLTPLVFGGNGGEYGQDGTSGTLTVNVRAQISVPLVGAVTVLNQNFPDPPLANFPAGGQGGFAVKRNGFPLRGISDGNYQNSNMRGRVGN